MKRQYHLYGKNREVFLRGLQRYRDRGVAILVDGREADASEWIKILEVQADGSFYMGDYIMDDFSGPSEEKAGREDKHARKNKNVMENKIRKQWSARIGEYMKQKNQARRKRKR